MKNLNRSLAAIAAVVFSAGAALSASAAEYRPREAAVLDGFFNQASGTKPYAAPVLDVVPDLQSFIAVVSRDQEIRSMHAYMNAAGDTLFNVRSDWFVLKNGAAEAYQVSTLHQSMDRDGLSVEFLNEIDGQHTGVLKEVEDQAALQIVTDKIVGLESTSVKHMTILPPEEKQALLDKILNRAITFVDFPERRFFNFAVRLDGGDYIVVSNTTTDRRDFSSAENFHVFKGPTLTALRELHVTHVVMPYAGGSRLIDTNEGTLFDPAGFAKEIGPKWKAGARISGESDMANWKKTDFSAQRLEV